MKETNGVGNGNRSFVGWSIGGGHFVSDFYYIVGCLIFGKRRSLIEVNGVRCDTRRAWIINRPHFVANGGGFHPPVKNQTKYYPL